MPETFIVYRKIFEEDLGLTRKWQALFRLVKEDENLWTDAKIIIEKGDFINVRDKTKNKTILKLLEFYTFARDDV